MEFFRPSFDKKFARSFREIWVEEKDCCFNLERIIIVFKLVINCEILSVEESFQRTCFGHAYFN